MKLSEIQPKFKFIALFTSIGILGLVVILIIAFSSFKKPVQPQAKPSIAPNNIVPPTKKTEELPKNVQTIKQQIVESATENKGGDLTLQKNEAFIIRYIPAPNVFMVTLLQRPAETYKSQAEDWFKKYGLKQEELCNLPVRFSLGTNKLRKENPNFSSLPKDCSGSPVLLKK